MAQKHALVVDDSLTARRILARMLERQNLRVDSVESAEEALKYLGKHRPDVVFMDHMMPGMDGMEALRSIKGNPDTVMIPVVMYTAKEGKLHVGQARALGAIGILSKQLRPGELFEVLQGLGLVEDQRTEVPVAEATVPDERAQVEDLDAPRESSAIGPGSETIEQIARATAAYLNNSAAQLQERRLLEEGIAQLRQSVSQLRGEVAENTASREDALGVLPGAVATEIEERRRSGQRQRIWSRAGLRFGSPLVLALGLLLVVPAAIGFGVLISDREERLAAGERDRWMIETVGWALSDEGQFEFGETVFDDTRLERLKKLVSRLSWLDFDGVVRLESYLGRPCLIGARGEGYETPTGSWPLDACDFLGVSDEEARELGALASEDFKRFVAEHAVGSAETIRVEIVSHGHGEPLHPYPQGKAAATAQPWNRIATLNNRVTVSIIPD